MAQAVLFHFVEQSGLGHAQFLAGLGQVAAAALQGVAEQIALERFHRFGKGQALIAATGTGFLERRQAQGKALGNVAQFTHVTRPVVAHQVRNGLVVQLRHRAVEA
ncbi:hypothetical protein D3C81_564950 [compost metagenome]